MLRHVIFCPCRSAAVCGQIGPMAESRLNRKQVVNALAAEAVPLMIIIPAAVVAHLIFHLWHTSKAKP